MKIKAQQLLLDDAFLSDQTVEVVDGKITDIYPSRNEPVAQQVAYLVPSYIDLQVNGGGGILLGENVTAHDLLTVSTAHAKFGSGHILPTLITNNLQAMQHCANAVSEVASDATNGILGVHFEGPWLATAKKGIHLESHIRAPSDAELAIVTRGNLGEVMITLAPETVPADVITDLVSKGVIVSLGHSNATHEQVLTALAAGATGFTHLYNAMSGCQGRQPGMVGTALHESATYAGIIVDHHHVDSYAVKLALKCKTPEKLCLVTDAMAHVGYEEDVLPYFATQITRKNGKLTTPEGTLAGSCLDMHQAVCNMYQDIGASLAESIEMATATPANWLKRYDIGRIGIGKRAHLLGLTQDLNISQHWRNGELLFDFAQNVRFE